MPTYIYNYDSTNEEDNAKGFQPRYLGANVLKNNYFHTDFEHRRDPSIVLLGGGKYILPNQRTVEGCLSNIKTELKDGYLALVFSKMQFQNSSHILGQWSDMAFEGERKQAIQFNGRFCYYKLEKNILNINILLTSDSMIEVVDGMFVGKKEVDYSTFQQTNVDLSNVVTVDEFFENPYVLGLLFPENEDGSKDDYDEKLNELKERLNMEIESLAGKDAFGSFKFEGDSKLNIIWKREDSGEIKLSMPKFVSEKLFVAHDQQGMRPSEINSKNLAKIKYNGDVSSCVEYDPSWGTETDDFKGSYRENMEEAIMAEDSKVLQAVYSLKQYIKDDSQAPNEIDGITDSALLSVANSCFDEKKVDQICCWLDKNGGTDLVTRFKESNKEKILKYLLDEYIKDKTAPLSLNKMKMCIEFFEAFYTAGNGLDVLMGLVNDAVQGDALKIEKAYNLLVVVGKVKADEFINQKIETNSFLVADLWHLVDSWTGYNDDHKYSYREAVKKKIATAINDNAEFNIKLESFGGFVKYLGYDDTKSLENKVAMIYRKHAITFMLILGFLLILNSVLSFAKLAIVVLNLLVGVINLVLFAHIQLFQVLAMPFIASFPLGMALVLCLSFVAYDVSTSFSKDSANEDQLCLWLYSLGVKGSDRMVSMLEDSLFYKTLMPYFTNYFTGANSKIAAVDGSGAVKSGEIGENTKFRITLDGKYAVLNNARCIRMQHANADGGRGGPSTKT
ncbi:MAG: hypothetical protein HON78_03915 [Legionellales bacterium]|jgi:hypothetical protein|nr:hypothetical protein [Legionellales bacterium]